MNHKPHCPVPVITYNGNLIVAAAQKYPKVAARLPANYLTETTTALGKIPADVTGQKFAKGEASLPHSKSKPSRKRREPILFAA